jgi:hypothetical protein
MRELFADLKAVHCEVPMQDQEPPGLDAINSVDFAGSGHNTANIISCRKHKTIFLNYLPLAQNQGRRRDRRRGAPRRFDVGIPIRGSVSRPVEAGDTEAPGWTNGLALKARR